MFDLNESLNDWREHLRQGERCRREDVDELEEHLREEMVKLEGLGLSGEEAFLLAARRLGGVDALAQEFEKVNFLSVWLNRLHWIAIGAIVGLSASAADAAFQKLWTMVAGWMQLNLYLAAATSPLLTLGILAAIVTVAVKVVKHRETHEMSLRPFTSRGRFGLLVMVFLWFTILPIGSTMAQISLYNCVPAVHIANLHAALLPGRFVLSVLVPVVIAAWILKPPRWVDKLLAN